MKPTHRAILKTEDPMKTEAPALAVGNLVKHGSSDKPAEVVAITKTHVRVRFAHNTETPILDEKGKPTGKFEQTFTFGDFNPAELTLQP